MSEIAESFWEMELEVEEANNTLKAMFKPDYEHTKDLERSNIYLTAELIYVTRLLKKRLHTEGATRIGTHFIRRKLTLIGLQLLNEDNSTIISKREEQYYKDLEIYNPLSCMLAMQVHTIFPHGNTRVSLFLKDETLGWIQDIAEMFNLNTYSIIHIAWGYAILKLIELNHLDAGLSENVKLDIEKFKYYISRKF